MNPEPESVSLCIPLLHPIRVLSCQTIPNSNLHPTLLRATYEKVNPENNRTILNSLCIRNHTYHGHLDVQENTYSTNSCSLAFLHPLLSAFFSRPSLGNRSKVGVGETRTFNLRDLGHRLPTQPEALQNSPPIRLRMNISPVLILHSDSVWKFYRLNRLLS